MVEWESVLREAAEEVQEVSDRYAGSLEGREEVGAGAGGDVTLKVDREAEEAILGTVRQMGGDLRIVSEEHGESGPTGARWTVVIDPIDGSSNYARQIPFYCTSVAVLEGPSLESARHALVRNLVNGETYYASSGSRSTKDGREVSTSGVEELADAIVGVDVSRASLATVRSVAELTSSVRRQVHFGANALEACMMAEGRIDGFLDVRGRIRVMDMAGAYLIGRQAGVVFSDVRGERLMPRISVSERFSVVAAANASLHSKILAKLRD